MPSQTPLQIDQITGIRPNGYAQISADGSSGGNIVVWKISKLTAKTITTLQHCVSIEFQTTFDKTCFKLTAVYGPPSQANRRVFFDELRSQQPSTDKPWIVLGDCNQTINITDRSNIARGPDRPFVSLIAELELIDLPLGGRRYTWSRGTNNPTFVRLDRVLVSNAWNTKFPNTVQTALQSILSDHCPILCTVKTNFQPPNTFRFENYWLQLHDFKQLVSSKWHQMALAKTPTQLSLKLGALRKEIIVWNTTRVGNIDAQASICNQTLMWITRAEEVRRLNQLEKLLRGLVIDRLLLIENLKETKWRQRTKRQWVQQGDKNTRYFHAMATHQKRTNSIASILVQGEETTRHSDKARTFFNYFCNLIGTHKTGTISFDLQALFHQATLSQTAMDRTGNQARNLFLERQQIARSRRLHRRVLQFFYGPSVA